MEGCVQYYHLVVYLLAQPVEQEFRLGTFIDVLQKDGGHCQELTGFDFFLVDAVHLVRLFFKTYEILVDGDFSRVEEGLAQQISHREQITAEIPVELVAWNAKGGEAIAQVTNNESMHLHLVISLIFFPFWEQPKNESAKVLRTSPSSRKQAGPSLQPLGYGS